MGGFPTELLKTLFAADIHRRTQNLLSVQRGVNRPRHVIASISVKTSTRQVAKENWPIQDFPDKSKASIFVNYCPE
jgi:hypothetical protein